MNGEVLEEVRIGPRNFLRPGHRVRVKPTQPGRHDGFIGLVRAIRDCDGKIEVDLIVSRPHPKAGTFRCVYLERLERVWQTRDNR